ncbi:ATPase [Shewanella algae]|nr:ATPase [Shewanella algae]
MPTDLEKPINQILFGPPGTGKTHETVRAALEILDPNAVKEFDTACLEAKSWADKCDAREQLKTRFDELMQKERIRFVTFHQSFSYEDFVEGLRAETDEQTGQIHYEIVDGVFKGLCLDALSGHANGSTFDEALARLQERLEQNDGRLSMTTVRGKVFDVTYDGGKTFRVFPSSTENEDPYYVASMENVQRLYVGESKKGMYNPSYVEGMLRYLLSECGLPPFTEMPPQRSQPFVLIIDEINRGNISRIFGELITLIEPSKRAGAPEALEVMLPYSKKPFKVPGNVYLIGTMNTADRSLAGLDIALRRRFTFKEMPPKPELFKELIIEGINIQMLLEVMNQRIAVLLDRDHCLGHAYFMPLFDTPTLEKLADIFKQNIIPLLQEYFFEDWERIRWVLNDQNKAKEDAFIVEESANLAVLFPGVSNKLRQSPRWRLNAEAFSRLSAFAGIVTSATSNTQSRENAPVSDLEPVDA